MYRFYNDVYFFYINIVLGHTVLIFKCTAHFLKAQRIYLAKFILFFLIFGIRRAALFFFFMSITPVQRKPPCLSPVFPVQFLTPAPPPPRNGIFYVKKIFR